MNCTICGNPLTGRQTFTCSRTCQIKRNGNIRRESGKLKTANMTVQQRERKRAAVKKDRENNPQRYYVVIKCLWCGKEFLSKHNAKQCGSKGCRKSYHLPISPSNCKDLTLIASPPRNISPKTTIVKGGWFTSGKCKTCGTNFTSRFSDTTCSKKCQKNRNKDHKRWITDDRRQAIYERDNWLCQICGLPVDKHLPRGTYTPNAPTLDHIMPRSLGGSHDDTNLRLAHHICNSKRGNNLKG